MVLVNILIFLHRSAIMISAQEGCYIVIKLVSWFSFLSITCFWQFYLFTRWITKEGSLSSNKSRDMQGTQCRLYVKSRNRVDCWYCKSKLFLQSHAFKFMVYANHFRRGMTLLNRNLSDIIERDHLKKPLCCPVWHLCRYTRCCVILEVVWSFAVR